MKKANMKTSYVTKKDLDGSLDHYSRVILGAMSEYAQKNKKEHGELRISLNQLTITLDGFLKRLTYYDQEFTILKAEVAQMKKVFKEKLGVEISLQA